MSDDPRAESERIADVTLDEHSVVRWSPEIDHERRVAIFDLLEENYFAPDGVLGGPYHLYLSIEENRLIFDIRNTEEVSLKKIPLPLTPLRSLIKDYFKVCESYFEAIKKGSRAQIESLDMGRRGLHDEGSGILQERLSGKVAIDNDTARRLFTLICVLHIRS